MLLIPTLFLRHQHVVNPAPDAKSPLPTDPLALGRQWKAAGIEMLHIVDLDAGVVGSPLPNLPLITRLVTECGFHCQVMGGIRTAETAKRYFDHGVARIFLESIAYQQPTFAEDLARRFPGRIGVEIAVRHGKVAIKGWSVAPHKSATDYLQQFRASGIAAVLYADVNEHGMLAAENFQSIRAFAQQAQMPVLHHTDLETTEQLEQLIHLEKFGVMGTILGKSVYEGRFDLEAIVTLTKEQEQIAAADEDTVMPS
ncbi:MAG: hypothetical protein HY696_02925 [Deltaproteobacteria bacterium]|nr:hypothetical protein [Deltaproteobacteria bacterium]